MAVIDPFKVLGVSSNATEEQVKSAYRELAKKYHPDNYADSPLADLANEKMQEVNEAYDEAIKIVRGRANANAGSQSYSSGSAGRAGYSGNAGYQQAGHLNDIRQLIQQNRLAEAEELLDGIPVVSRDGEWYFLKGTVYYQRGWLDDAMNHFASACRLSPNNPEYRAAMQRMSWQRQGNMGTPGGAYRTSGTAGGCNACDMCSSLVCADCCCECMGGDLISCC